MERFTLRKSYLDAVDHAGRCAIAYSSELRWGPLALRWEAVSLREPGCPPVHRSAWRPPQTATAVEPASGSSSGVPIQAPTCLATVLSEGAWRSDALGFSATCEPWCRPFATRLFETASGTIDWSCEAPGAKVAIQFDDGRAVCGAGYAEQIVLAMPPWRLPIDELRWGRWIADENSRSIVWIDWRGAHPLTLVLENGVPRGCARVTDESVEAEGMSLHLTATETLYSRTLAETLRGAGPVVQRLSASWRAVEDRKSLSRGLLGEQSGWAIHELVRFP